MKILSQELEPENETVMVELDRRMNDELVSELIATQDFDYCKEQGDEWYKAGIYDTALNHHMACVQINPKNAEALNSRGMTLYQLKRYEESLLDYTSAIALKLNSEFLYNRAVTLIALEREEEALVDLMQGLKINPWDMGIIKMMLIIRSRGNVDIPHF